MADIASSDGKGALNSTWDRWNSEYEMAAKAKGYRSLKEYVQRELGAAERVLFARVTVLRSWEKS